jgi:serine phosphatase RsbU (regulator of sigma subunit)
MVALMLAIVGGSVLVVSAIALVGVYRMVQGDEASRLIAYRQIVADGLSARMETAERVVDSLGAALAAHPADESAVARALATAAQANIESFDLVAVTDASGTLVASEPEPGRRRGIDAEVLERARQARSAGLVFQQRPVDSAQGRIWLAKPFSAADGRKMLLLARLREGFQQVLVNEIDSKESRRASAILDRRGRLVAAGADGPPLDLGSVRFDPSPEAPAGTTSGLSSPKLGEMLGYWSRLSLGPGLEWRVLVAEPASAALFRTRAALLPASLAVVLATLAATWLSGLFARRLVQPLHEFEERARAVVSGSVVNPLESARTDEIGRLADAFDAMLVRLNALRELSRLLARSSHMPEVLRGTLAAIVRLLGPDVVPVVFLLDVSRDSLDLVAVPDNLGLPPGVAVPRSGDSWPALALRTREPICFGVETDLASGAPAMRAFADAGVRSGLALPLVVSGEPIGVLMALSREETEFSEAEREMLSTFAAQAAMAIENSRLFEEERQSRREAEALRVVAEELESPADLRAALEHVAGIAAELLNASCRKLTLGNGIEVGLASLRDPEFQSWDALFSQRSGADPHTPVLIEHHDAVPGLLPQSHSAVMLIPLLQGGVRRGMFVLDCTGVRDGFSERQVTLATTIGREVSLALENAFLLHQARNRAMTLDTIFRISQAVSSSLQSTVVLNRVLDVVQKILSAEAVSLMTFDPVKKTVVTAMARGILDREMLYFETSRGEDLPGAVFESGRAELYANLGGLNTPLARLASRSGFRSLLAVPLLARGRSLGVLSVYSTEGDAFDTQELELLQTFASQAALAIDTAQLYGREHHVASVLKSSILPDRLPSVPGLDMASVYRPGGQEAEIGGDYFDVFPAPDGRIVLVIADVAGKGVVAATKTSMIRYSLRGMVAAGLGPADVLSELNKMVGETGDASEIVTVWVGFLDIGQRVVTFADAGHPPALLYHPERRSVERLVPTGPVLGAVAGGVYREERTGVEEGSALLLYTDGVTEARRKGKFFGEGRVRRALRAGGSAAVTAERLMAAVDAFSGGEMRDDAAVLVVRLTEGASRADDVV